jgi:hypothetical protein
MRSLAFALLQHEGDNPAKRDAEPDQPWRDNLRRAKKIRAEWRQGKVSAEAAADMLAALRTASHADACAKVVELLNKKIDPRSIWDGIFLCAAELLMRNPNIIGVHCVTSVNALHYGYETSGNDETRRMLMLQAPAFLSLFQKRIGAPRPGALKIDALKKGELKATGAGAIEEIFADVQKHPLAAAQKTLAFLDTKHPKPRQLITMARRLIFNKGTDAHSYKFSSAALEDYYNVTSPWRAKYLAANTFWLRGSGEKDNQLIQRAQAALWKA